MGRLRDRRATGLALVALALLVGCGDQRLWLRYQAERDLWKALKLVERIEAAPAGSGDLQARARAALQDVVRNYPPARWVGGRTRVENDVAQVSGRAALALARLEGIAGRSRAAAESYAQVLQDYRSILPVGLEAASGRAQALEAAGEGRAAAAAWAELGRDFPILDPARKTAILVVLDAPPRAARLLAAAGDSAGGDRTLREAVVRYARTRPLWTGTQAAPEIWLRLAEAHGALGEIDRALDALRSALQEPELGRQRGPVLLGLADRSLAGGRPDSALVYAAWAEHDLAEMSRGRAILLGASAWEAVGRPDSALEAYRRFLDGFPQSGDSTALAQFRRGALLERMGNWEQARSEYHALAAAYPAHALSFAALLRIVRHHARRGESELADFEARRALETVEQVIASYKDPEVLAGARKARAELRHQLGRDERREPNDSTSSNETRP